PPQPVSVNEGDIASFSVAVNGTGPFRYQWRRNGAEIPGAYESTHMFTAARLNNGDEFSVDVTNALGAVTSQSANLTVAEGEISLYLGMLGANGNLFGIADQARF